MAINPNTVANYADDRFAFINGGEGFVGHVYSDTPTVAVPTIGYGIALLVRNIVGQYVPRSNLSSVLAAGGITWETSDEILLGFIQSALNNSDVTLSRMLIEGGFTVADVFADGNQIPTVYDSTIDEDVALLEQDGGGSTSCGQT